MAGPRDQLPGPPAPGRATSPEDAGLGAESSELVFKAISDSTRRRVLAYLAGGPLAAGEIASRFSIAGPSVSRHLSVLRAAGLVHERREANRVIYTSVPGRLTSTLSAFTAAVGGGAPANSGSGPAPDSRRGAKAKDKDKRDRDKKKKRRAAAKAGPAPEAAGAPREPGPRPIAKGPEEDILVLPPEVPAP